MTLLKISESYTSWGYRFRPGIKLEEEPPALRMNNMLGGILTHKLKGENVIRK
jgi:hypothetical protein